jgi:hypothetical protein
MPSTKRATGRGDRFDDEETAVSGYFQLLSRATAYASTPEPWADGRCGGRSMWCEWSSGGTTAWIDVHGWLDDTTAHRLAEALNAVHRAEVRVLDMSDAYLGPASMQRTLTVLRSPRVVLKDPPDGLLELLDADAKQPQAA